MVSIFADSIVQETVTLSFNNGDRVSNISQNIPFTTNLNKFVYVETLNITFSMDSIDLVNTSDFGRNADLGFNIEFSFNDVVFNSVGGNLFLDESFSGNESRTISPPAFTNTTNPDFYLDSLLDITVALDGGGGSQIEFDGNQNADFDLEIVIIGRTP